MLFIKPDHVNCRDDVYRSSLLGTFLITRAVWPIMCKQRYGRIVNCVSASGLYGNFGQVNYAAMKMGLVGFTSALHREGTPPYIPLENAYSI